MPSSSASVLRVRIPAGDCVELWAECSALGQKSRALREAQGTAGDSYEHGQASYFSWG